MGLAKTGRSGRAFFLSFLTDEAKRVLIQIGDEQSLLSHHSAGYVSALDEAALWLEEQKDTGSFETWLETWIKRLESNAPEWDLTSYTGFYLVGRLIGFLQILEWYNV